MTDKELVVEAREQSKALVVHDNGPNSTILDSGKFTQLQRAAAMFATSSLVPDAFRGKPQDCFVALDFACRLGISPFQAFQNLYVVHGKPGLQAQLVIALMNQKGPFDGPVEFEYKGSGDKRSCTAYGIMRGSGRRCEATVDWDTVKAEKWLDKPNSKWKTMPEQMLAYRSATFLARRYCPDVLLGFQTVEEIEDVTQTKELPKTPVTVGAVIEKVKDKAQEQEAKQEPEKPKKRVVVKDATVDKAKEILESKSEVEFVRELADFMRWAKSEGVKSAWINKAFEDIGIDPHDLASQTADRIENFRERVSIYLG